MSIILAQQALKAVILVGLKSIQKNSEVRKIFLDNYEDFDATFRQFDLYAKQYNISLDNFIEPIAEIEKFILNTEFNVKLGYPRLNASLPEICLVLGNDGESSGTIGDIADENRDENGNQKIIWSSQKRKSINIHLSDDSPDRVDILHNILDYVLVTHRTLLDQVGLTGCQFDASDVHPSQEGLASGIFLFERVITVSCEAFQTYKTSFYGYTPMPTQVAMSSDLTDQPDVNVDDLVEETIIEETPPPQESSVFYTIGDQIPKDTSMEMIFRGVSLESTITKDVVTSLGITTFDQQIIGEFVFEPQDEYIIFAYPKSLGAINFLINQVSTSFFRQEIDIESSHDAEIMVTYYVYRSEIKYTGTKFIETVKV